MEQVIHLFHSRILSTFKSSDIIMDYVREHTISLYVLQILSSSSTGNTFAYLFRPLCMCMLNIL